MAANVGLKSTIKSGSFTLMLPTNLKLERTFAGFWAVHPRYLDLRVGTSCCGAIPTSVVQGW